jgi:hypothetical protein
VVCNANPKRKSLGAFCGVCRNSQKERLMKSIRRFAQVQVLLLSLLSSTVVPMTAHADEVRGAFTLTAETHWGKAVLPAGYYTFTVATQSSLPTLLIRSANGAKAAFIAAASETSTAEKTPNAITIKTIDGVQVITELHVNDAGLVLHYETPASETASATRTAEPKLTAYAAGKK